jgi:hypothetical protein
LARIGGKKKKKEKEKEKEGISKGPKKRKSV